MDRLIYSRTGIYSMHSTAVYNNTKIAAASLGHACYACYATLFSPHFIPSVGRRRCIDSPMRYIETREASAKNTLHTNTRSVVFWKGETDTV